MNQIFATIPQNLVDNALKVCHKWKYKEINGCYVDPKRKLLFVNSFNEKPFLAQTKLKEKKTENFKFKNDLKKKSIYECSVNEIDKKIKKEYQRLFAIQYPEEAQKMKEQRQQRLQFKQQKQKQDNLRQLDLNKQKNEQCFADFKKIINKQKQLNKKLRPSFRPKRFIEDERQDVYYSDLQGKFKDQVNSNLLQQKRQYQKQQYQDIIDKFQIVYYENTTKKRNQDN